MYQTYKKAIEILEKDNKITIDENNKLIYIPNKKEHKEEITKEGILFNISHYKYELITPNKIKKSKIIDIEDLIINILIKFPEARLIESIPFLLKNNKINKFKLYRLSYNYNLINEIGFFIDISKNKELKDLKIELKKDKDKNKHYLTYAKNKKYIEENTPEELKEWNLRGLFRMEDFIKDAY